MICIEVTSLLLKVHRKAINTLYLIRLGGKWVSTRFCETCLFANASPGIDRRREANTKGSPAHVMKCLVVAGAREDHFDSI